MYNETIVRDIRIQEQLLKQRGVYGKILNPEDIFGSNPSAMSLPDQPSLTVVSINRNSTV